MLTRNLLLGMLTPSFLAAAGIAVNGTQEHFRNVTIDDSFGDEITNDVPIYEPTDKWQTSGGHANPDVALARNGTWHDTTRYPEDAQISVSFGFTGQWNLRGGTPSVQQRSTEHTL